MHLYSGCSTDNLSAFSSNTYRWYVVGLLAHRVSESRCFAWLADCTSYKIPFSSWLSLDNVAWIIDGVTGWESSWSWLVSIILLRKLSSSLVKCGRRNPSEQKGFLVPLTQISDSAFSCMGQGLLLPSGKSYFPQKVIHRPLILIMIIDSA